MNDLVTDPNLVMPSLSVARAAQPAWAATPIAARAAVLARTRNAIARDAAALAALLPRPQADSLAAEILPLAEAARFLARHAPRLLRAKRLRGGAPWLFGIRQEIRREPRGAVLVLGPGNYPLFLPGTHALQALAAGNAVAVKPAPGATAPMQALARILAESGLPDGLFQILAEESGPESVAAGYDFIVLTGSAETGHAVARAAADTLTQTTMELSGVDAAFVLPGADLALVAASLAYGLRLNAGATCIAPRRVFVARADHDELLSRLQTRLPPPAPVPAATAARLAALADDAVAAGARIAARNPTVLADADPTMPLLQQDVFAPWLALVPVDTPEAALAAAAICPYALGASVWGPPAEAAAFAARVRAGSVCVNDLVMPTADPRLPFGGRGRSGYGVTRGAEGLLEMTAVKTVSIRRHGPRPHLDPRMAADPARLLTLIQLLHGTWTDRWNTIRKR